MDVPFPFIDDSDECCELLQFETADDYDWLKGELACAGDLCPRGVSVSLDSAEEGDARRILSLLGSRMDAICRLELSVDFEDAGAVANALKHGAQRAALGEVTTTAVNRRVS